MREPLPPSDPLRPDPVLQPPDRKQGETAVWKAADAARRFAEAIIATVREPLLVLTADLRIRFANRAFYRTFRVEPEETVGRCFFDIGDRQWDIPELRRLLGEILPRDSHFEDFLVEHDFARIGRKCMLLNARRVLEAEGAQAMMLLAIEDVTERKCAEEKLVAAAVTDPLTGLLNRRGLFERLRNLIAGARRDRRRFQVLFLDLDDLKSINDRLGHEEGDRALADAAAVLRATFPAAEAIARIGGDEFVAAPVGAEAGDADEAVARLQKALNDHNRSAGRPCTLSLSAGRSEYDPVTDPDIGRLMAMGDAAMYLIKRERRRS